MIKVYFVDTYFWDDNGCDCCEPTLISSIDFSHIEGIENPEKYQSYDYEMYNGSKGSEYDCLVSVFWDLVANQECYNDFYEIYQDFEGIEESEIKLMLLAKDIEVVFLEE